MNRPDLNEFPSTDSRTYKLLIKVVYEDYDWKRFAIDESRYTDEVLEDNKYVYKALNDRRVICDKLEKSLQIIRDLTIDEDLPLFKAIHDIANKTPKL